MEGLSDFFYERERESLQTTFLFRADSPDFLSKRTGKFLCQTLFVIFFFFFDYLTNDISCWSFFVLC